MRAVWHGHRFQEDLGHAGSKEAAEWLRLQLIDLLPTGIDRTRVGVYVATGDAGVDVSVAFWQAALTEGVDFVNPRDFPWTLASGMTAHATCEAGLQGPCLTLIGDASAGIAALAHGIRDLQIGVVDLALVAGIELYRGDPASIACPAAVIALAADTCAGSAALVSCGVNDDTPLSAYAAEPLARMCRAVENRQDLTVGAAYEGGFRLVGNA